MNVTALASPSSGAKVYSNERFVDAVVSFADVPLTHLTKVKPFADAVAVIVIVLAVLFVPVYETEPSKVVPERFFRFTTIEFSSQTAVKVTSP